MDVALAALTLLGLVVLSGLFGRLRGLPLPLVQIALGACAALPPVGLTLDLDPALFMLLFVPPLLFSDGWRASKRELATYRGPILMLALGLVLLTTLAAGLAAHALLPALPLSAAFVLGAALSPTDAVAVSALSGRGLPAPLAHVLEGETLINDASGLVAVKFAVAVTLGLGLAPAPAAWTLLWTGAGGVAVGLAAGALFPRAHAILTGRCGADAETANLLLLVLPYAAYLAAEHLHCSGVLAVAVAGLAAGRLETIRRGRPADRLLGSGLWSLLGRALGGMVFLLVGLQLPGMLGRLPQGVGGEPVARLVLGMFGLLLALALLRFSWLWATLRLASPHGRSGALAALPRWRTALAGTLAGVRGPITVAAVLALPIATAAGDAFPARDLVITLATGVVLLSLLVATVALPVAARGLRAASGTAEEAREAEAALARAAMRAAEHACHHAAAAAAESGDDAAHAAARHIVAGCQRRMAADGQAGAAAERAMRLAVLEAEREELYRLRAAQRIGDPVLHHFLQRIDLVEMSLVAPPRP